MSYNPVPSLNNGNATFDNDLNVSGISTFDAGIKTPLNTAADGATVTFDMDVSNNHSVTLGGNRALSVSNVDAGQKFTLRLKQDGTGSRVVTWWSGITWFTSAGAAPTLKTDPNTVDYIGFICTSGGYYEGFHLTENSSGGGGGSSSITVRESDGTPNVSNVSTIVVSNGTLTDDGSGQVTISTGGGGGGGSYDDTYVSGVSTFASGLAIQNQTDIATVSGLLYDDAAVSGYFESRVDSADSSITANSGYFESRVDQNTQDIITVSGLTGGSSSLTVQDVDGSPSVSNVTTIRVTNGSLTDNGGGTVTIATSGGGGGGTTYTAGSGLSLVGSEFNVYGGSGNFEYIELQTDNTTIPKFKFTGSGVTDTPISLEVASSFESASSSGSALLFQGTQGQLFSITDNLSSGTIFNVSDITGLPMLEVDASGHVQIGEFADDITIHQPILLSGGVPTSTTNKLYNNAGTLYFNGSAVGAGGGGGGLPYSSGDYYLQEIRANSASGVAISGLISPNTFNITGGDGSNYTIDGMGLSSASDPTMYIHKGHTYVFNKTFSGHPFAVSATDGGSVYSDADGNAIEIGSSAGSVTFEVPQDAPDKLYYYCTAHPSTMKGVIYTTTDGATSGYFESRADTNETNIALKANIASPTFTGTPAAPTATAGTNTTQLATTAFVSTAVANLVDSAPTTLDTLNELAAALGDDANFSTTVTNSLADKLENIVEDTTPQLGGTLDANGNTIDMGTYVITDAKVGQWDTAYGWGDHASAGYLTAHPTISAASSSNNSGRTYIQDVILDSNGHVTGLATATETVTDTTYTAGAGITLTGTTFDVNVSATTQTVAANTVSATSSRTYAVQVNASDELVVNVPWTDTDTNTQLSQEQVEDFAGNLIATGGTKTGITVTYQDSTNDVDFVVGGLTTTEIAASTLVTESEGISSNDNDTTIPTSAAVKDYVDNNAGGGGGGGGTVQGTDGTYDIQPTSEGATAGNARGESSVDLQTQRTAATQVASGGCSVVGGGCRNTASAGFSTVSGGRVNTASGSYSTVGGGYGNTASGNTSSILGGRSGCASNTYSTISGGYRSWALGSYSIVVAGNGNTANNTHSIVVGGNGNTASGACSFVAGGATNCASDVGTVVSGGISNTASGAQSTVGGGCNNTASCVSSTVSGGQGNTASGFCSTVGGGINNTASGANSTVGGGGHFSGGNTASGGCSTISGGKSNTASSSYSTVGGGSFNTSSGAYSTITGGLTNTASGMASTISGANNTASGYVSTIGGGYCNITNARYSIIAGGHRNVIQSPTNECCSRGATISGGVGHNSSGGTLNATTGNLTGTITCCDAGRFSTIAGGLRNIATGICSTVSGGSCNTASGTQSTTGGGQLNTASGSTSTISGGFGNCASGVRSTVSGGSGNIASNCYSTVGGGTNNTASGRSSTVSGGYNNTACGWCSAIGGGRLNVASSSQAAISGGYGNTASGGYSSVVGGYGNTASGYMSTVGGGGDMFGGNTASGQLSTIGGGGGLFGGGNTASNNYATVGGGCANTASGRSSTVSGGDKHTASATNSSVAGGCCNITNARHSIVAGGHRNIIQSPTNECCSRGATIGGGVGHNSSGGTLSTTTGDLTGTITCCDAGAYSTIAGGLRNCATGNCSFVGGGCCNTASASYSTVGGGDSNTASGLYSSVGGGGQNTASGSSSTISGGYSNTASSVMSTVGGGRSNNASGGYSTVGGGGLNTASGTSAVVSGGGGAFAGNTASGNYSVVAGGGGLFAGNTASGCRSTVSGGYNNTASNNGSVVGGGNANTASGGYSTVGGGQNNTASASFSAVSGGDSNTASGSSSTVIGGARAKATKYAEVAHAAGRFAADGDAQHSVLVARDSTTDATANQVLFLDGSSERLTIPAETTWMFTIKLAAHNDTDNDGGWWFFRGGIRRDASNNTSLIGTVFEEHSKDTNLNSASASVVADDTNEALEIRVTGVASKNIRWVAVVDISQVSWGTP